MAAVLGVAVGLAGCAGGSGGAGTITLYNGQHVQTTDALVQAFEKSTGIQVRIHSDDESVLADQIVTEGAHSPADVFFTENTPALAYLQSKHLLAHLDGSVRATTQARYDSTAGDWVGVSARVSVLVYNPSLIKPADLPTSVLQLADPRYKGMVALAPGETDFQPIVTSVLKAEGKAATLTWLEGLKANAAGHIYPDNETITSEVNAGQVAMGVINQYYWYRLRAQLGSAAMHSVITTFAPVRSWVRDRRLGRRRARIERQQDRRDEVRAVPHDQEGAGDHRPQRQLRVPDRRGRDDRRARDPLLEAATRPDLAGAAG